MIHRTIKAITPTIITTDMPVTEFYQLNRRLALPFWYLFVPGWVVRWHTKR